MMILKLLSQLLILAVGITSVIQAHVSIKPNGSKRRLTPVGFLTLGVLFTGFLVFFFTDRNERKENAEKNTAQEKTIEELGRLNQQLTQVSLDRELREIEISFVPTPQQSSLIADAYRKTTSPVKGIPYRDATMKAERVSNHWRIDFDPVSNADGVIRFPPLLSDQASGKAFEEVLRHASIPLWIKWGAGPATELEPLRDQFPSAVIVSENSITYVLRAPSIAINLNHLRADPTLTLRGEGDIKSLRIRSGDPGVIFDQVLDLNWKEDRGSDKDEDIYIKRTKPYISGPHRLLINFKTVSPVKTK